MPAPTTFNCPHCAALYKVVRIETPQVSVEREITCRRCGGPLQGREGRFILKYFFVDRPSPGASVRDARTGTSILRQS